MRKAKDILPSLSDDADVVLGFRKKLLLQRAGKTGILLEDNIREIVKNMGTSSQSCDARF